MNEGTTIIAENGTKSLSGGAAVRIKKNTLKDAHRLIRIVNRFII
jgi:hypothetical protein